jgi:hypothetical protein
MGLIRGVCLIFDDFLKHPLQPPPLFSYKRVNRRFLMKALAFAMAAASFLAFGSTRATADDFAVAWDGVDPSVSYIHSNYKCVAYTECPAGVFIVNAVDLNARGCAVSGTTCSGTCEVCTGGGTTSLCKAFNGDSCVIGGAGLSKCGSINKGTCTYLATSSTPNKCTCPLLASIPTETVCNIQKCQ